MLCGNELRIITTESHRHMRRISWDLEPSKLKNLKVVQVCGPQAMQMKIHLINVLPDPQEWTDFQLIDISKEPGFYLEKNVELCEELEETKLTKQVAYQRENPAYDIGWFLISEYLLKEVINITHEDVPESFCCLTAILEPLEQDKEPCLLKINEAKRLLNDPKYQISFLYFKHSIEVDCDAHLVASAFPNLTELVLCDVIKGKVSNLRKKKHSKKCLRRKARSSSQGKTDEIADSTNLHSSSFEMLVENTRNLTDLTIYAQNEFNEEFDSWDLAALNLIPRWTNLRTLRLACVPIKDGKFLIDIGKECKKLEKLVLHNLKNGDPDNSYCYSIDLEQMLIECKNLREFSIEEDFIENIPKVLESISNNNKLKKFSLKSCDERNKLYETEDLISSIKKLISSCEKLNTFVFILEPLFQKDHSNELTTALQGIIEDLNRENFQFQTVGNNYSRSGYKIPETETVFEDASPFFFPSILDGIGFN